MRAILILAGLMMAAALIIEIRNVIVYRARTKLLREMSAAAKADINAGRYDWQWRYEAFDEVSYGQMMLRFWRKPRSLYSDLRFTESA